jgi:acetyl-CoA carboxylase biotin carboxyl carrier protein
VSTQIKSDMVASVWQVLVLPGDEVSAGDVMVVLESMKMEIPVEAPTDGTVISVFVTQGDKVGEDQVLVVID